MLYSDLELSAIIATLVLNGFRIESVHRLAQRSHEFTRLNALAPSETSTE